MGLQESLEKSQEEISRFFESAPSISIGLMLDTNTGKVDFDEPHTIIPPAELAKPAPAPGSPLIKFNGSWGSALPANSEERFREMADFLALETLHRPLTPELLLTNVCTLGVYFQALQDCDVIKDFIIQFDESTSSHRHGTINYSCQVEPAGDLEYDDSWLRRCWDTFIAFLREPRVAARLAELIREAWPQAIPVAKDFIELVSELLKLFVAKGLLNEPPLTRPV